MKTYPPAPTGAEIRDYLERHNLTSREVGQLLQLGDPDARTVRLWMQGKRTMPYSQWYTLRTKVEGKPPD